MSGNNDGWLGELVLQEQERRISEDNQSHEEILRDKYPTLQDAYEKYQAVLSLVQEQDEKTN